MYCRTHQARIALVRDYYIRPEAHLRILEGQTKLSDTGAKLTREYYVFSVHDRKHPDLPAIEAIQCGLATAKDLLLLSGEEPLPLFCPILSSLRSGAPRKKNEEKEKTEEEKPSPRTRTEHTEKYKLLASAQLRTNRHTETDAEKSIDLDAVAEVLEAASAVVENADAILTAASTRGSVTSSTKKPGGGVEKRVWNEAARQLYLAILLIITCWDAKNTDGALFSLLSEAIKYFYCEPYPARVEAVNNIIKKDYHHRTLSQMISEELGSSGELRDYSFHLLQTILKDHNIPSYF